MQWADKGLNHPAVVRARTFWRRYRRWYNYDRALTRALDSNLGPPDGALIDRVIEGWGDDTLGADDPFLWSCIQEVSRTVGPIIQFGAGLSTLLLGIYAQRGQKHLWTLEHNKHWANTVRTQLKEYDITLAHVIAAALRHDGKRLWYNIDIGKLPKAFSVAICDGDSIAPTGYPGVFDHLIGRMAAGAVIVVRNVRKTADANFLTSWAKANGASSFVRQADEPYVKIVLKKVEKPAAEYSVRHSLAPQRAAAGAASSPAPARAAASRAPATRAPAARAPAAGTRQPR